MKTQICVYFICLLFSSATAFIARAEIGHTHQEGSHPILQTSNYGDTTFKIVASANETYGYEIFISKKILIRQLTIPGRGGVEGFKNKTDAKKCAQFVIKKLSQGIMPPTVNAQELSDLKID